MLQKDTQFIREPSRPKAIRFWLVLLRVASALAILHAGMSAASADGEIELYVDGPLKPAVEVLIDKFTLKTRTSAKGTFAPAPILKQRLIAGGRPDILMTLASEISALDKEGKLSAKTGDIARVKLGVAVKAGVNAPSISSLDDFKRLAGETHSLIHNNVASGLAFARRLEAAGLSDLLKPKIVVVPPAPGVIAELGKREGLNLGIGQMTQLVEASRVGQIRIVGVLPEELQAEIVYAAGALSSSNSKNIAKAFIEYVQSPEATSVFEASGAR